MAGSRVRFYNKETDRMILLHKLHPENEIKGGALKSLKQTLQRNHILLKILNTKTILGQSNIKHQMNPAFTGWAWDTIEVPIERYLNPAAKIDTFTLFENQQKISGISRFMQSNEHNQAVHNAA